MLHFLKDWWKFIQIHLNLSVNGQNRKHDNTEKKQWLNGQGHAEDFFLSIRMFQQGKGVSKHFPFLKMFVSVNKLGVSSYISNLSEKQASKKTKVTFKRVPNHRRLLIIDGKTYMSLPNKQRRASTRLAELKV